MAYGRVATTGRVVESDDDITNLPGLVVYFRASDATLANWVPPVATGGGAPTVTIHASATTPAIIYDIRVRITGDGDETHATFAWDVSGDGGATWTQQAAGLTAAASVALGTSGCVLAFGAGSYTTSHSYRTGSNTSSITSVAGTAGAVSLVQATNAGRPAVRYDAAGRRILYGDGTDDTIKLAIAGLSQPITKWVYGKWVSASSGKYIFDGNTASNCALCPYSATTIRAYGGLALDYDCLASVPTSLHLWCIVYNGESSIIYCDDTSVATGNAGTATPNGLTLHGRSDGGESYVGNTYIYESGMCAGAIDPSNVTKLYNSCVSLYGTT